LLAIFYGCFLLYSTSPSSWPLRNLLIAQTSILLGAIALSLSAFSLTLGCGGILVVVTLLIYGVSYILEAPELWKNSWSIVLPILLGFSAWRSQRIWTIIFTSCITGVIILGMITPTNWLSYSYIILFVFILGFWVDKNDIPMRIGLTNWRK
jgi:hypothetical protein